MLVLIQYGIIIGLAIINLITLTLLIISKKEHRYDIVFYEKKLVELAECTVELLSKKRLIVKLEKENTILRKTVDLNQEINNHLNQLNNEQNKS